MKKFILILLMGLLIIGCAKQESEPKQLKGVVSAVKKLNEEGYLAVTIKTDDGSEITIKQNRDIIFYYNVVSEYNEQFQNGEYHPYKIYFVTRQGDNLDEGALYFTDVYEENLIEIDGKSYAGWIGENSREYLNENQSVIVRVTFERDIQRISVEGQPTFSDLEEYQGQWIRNYYLLSESLINEEKLVADLIREGKEYRVNDAVVPIGNCGYAIEYENFVEVNGEKVVSESKFFYMNSSYSDNWVEWSNIYNCTAVEFLEEALKSVGIDEETKDIMTKNMKYEYIQLYDYGYVITFPKQLVGNIINEFGGNYTEEIKALIKVQMN